MDRNQACDTHLFIHEQLDNAQSFRFATGEAVVFSKQSPDKDAGGNEDACALIQLGPESGLLVLADGVGGHRGGQDASALAINMILDICERAETDDGNLREPILDAIEQCNQTLLDEGLGAATTLLVVEIRGDMIRPYFIGDSTILACGQRGKPKFQSIAQSPTGYALEAGVMREAEAREDENRYLVSNIIGAADMHTTVGSWLKLASRDTLLMCSDGLTENLYFQSIIDIMRCGPLMTAATRLHEQSTLKMQNESGHPDDLSFILFRLRP